MKKYLKIKISSLIVGLLVLMNPFLVLANTTVIFNNPTKQKGIMDLVNAVLDFVTQIGAIVAVFFLVYAGFQFVFARGDTKKLEDARKSLFWTLVGGLIVLGAFALSEIIKNTAKGLGVDI
jgi:type III secretory pathway component EscU